MLPSAFGRFLYLMLTHIIHKFPDQKKDVLRHSASGPAFSRLDRLLPIGPRAKGGSALRLLTYTLNQKFFLALARDPLPSKTIENKNELRGFLTQHYSFFNHNNGYCFSAMCSLSFFNSGREDKVLKLFSVSLTSVSYLAS